MTVRYIGVTVGEAGRRVLAWFYLVLVLVVLACGAIWAAASLIA